MEKRILLAFVLSGLVMFLYYGFLAPPPQPVPPAGPPPAAGSTPPAETAPAPQPAAAPERMSEAPETTIDTMIAAPATTTTDVRAEFAEEVRVDTARYSIIVSNEGGLLRSLRLKDYEGPVGEDDRGLLARLLGRPLATAPIELINQDAGASVGWPLAFSTGDPATDEQLRTALYVADRDSYGIRFEYAADGLRARKEFRFDPETYSIEVDASLSRAGRPVPFSIVWQGGFGDQSRRFDATSRSLVYHEAGDFERLNVMSVEASQDIAPATYVGVEDQFFIAMFLPAGVGAARAEAAPFTRGEDEIQTVALSVPAPGGTLPIYVGPKQQDALGAVDAGLVPVIDYGFFEILSRPLLFGLLWIHSYVGNYGWSIIILTMFINFILFPLRLKGQLSMLKMQKIQPQMKTLQDKYKKMKANDPRRPEVQTEMMGLYKKHGVNPLGGCLPMLLQMPFLFAFFTLLRMAIEVRGEPWMLWIRDLSAPDPFSILPVLMGASMFVMQKMTPMTMDPTQARMMMMMPVMLSGMFIFFPVAAGLMLYWLTSNVVGVGQQLFINKYWAPAAGGKPKPAATPARPVEVEVVEENPANDNAEPKRRKRRGRRK